ncbi:MAG: Mth938-like domain-containing protein [Thermodesulfovibrio sp.]|nr:Mth938-like domain-containing protein [Thermodesulfovibrio sp.]
MKITQYSFGKIVVDGIEYSADLIVFPDTIYPNWWRKQGHSLCMEDLVEVFKNNASILVVGTGAYGRMVVPEDLIKELKSRGIDVYVDLTDKAVRIFNDFLKEGKRVAGAFHLTC